MCLAGSQVNKFFQNCLKEVNNVYESEKTSTFLDKFNVIGC